MALNAKFKCETVLHGLGGVFTPRLRAVNGAKGSENADWARYTPSGSIEMLVDNPAAADFFQPGHEYIVTFTDVTADAKA